MDTLPSNVDDAQFGAVRGIDGHAELRDGLHWAAADAFVELATWTEEHEEHAGFMEWLLELFGNVLGELPNGIGYP